MNKMNLVVDECTDYVKNAIQQNTNHKIFGVVGFEVELGLFGEFLYFTLFHEAIEYAKQFIHSEDSQFIILFVLDETSGLNKPVYKTNHVTELEEFYEKVTYISPEERQKKLQEIEEYLTAYQL